MAGGHESPQCWFAVRSRQAACVRARVRVLSLSSCAQVQSWTPQLFLGPLKQMPANKHVAVLWNTLLVATPFFMAVVIQGSDIFTVSRPAPAHAHALHACSSGGSSSRMLAVQKSCAAACREAE